MAFIPPMLATRLADPCRLADPRYVADPKLDGQCAQLRVIDHGTRMCSAAPGTSSSGFQARLAARDPLAGCLGHPRR